MKYEQLSEELRLKLEAERFAAVRYSSAADEPNDKVDDAILYEISTPESSLMDGFVKAPPSVWFEFHSKKQSDEDAVKSVREALGIFPSDPSAEEAVPSEEAVAEEAAEQA